MTSHSRPVATDSSPFPSSHLNNINPEQPHLLAGAYIRSLVKHLSSSSSKAQHLHTMSSSASSQDQKQQGHEQAAALNKPQQMKTTKQTRRRVHTSRPYQERLLNMAEARREIVSALRVHRANMRQQSDTNKYHRQQPQLHQPADVQVMFQEQSQAFVQGVPAVATMSYGAAASSDNHLCSYPHANLISGADPACNYSSSSMLSYDLAPLEEEAPAVIGGALVEQLACSLPAHQPLGLNLSFQGFDSSLLDTAKNSDDPFGVPLIQSLSACPVASSYSSPVTTPAMSSGHGGGYLLADAPAALSHSQVLDADGERQSMELNETAANVAAASAWWTKILDSMESGGGESAGAPPLTTAADGEVGMADDDVAVGSGWPEWQWLCDGVGGEQGITAGHKSNVAETTVHVEDGDYSSFYDGDKGGDIALPCTNIGDIEGWDEGEWFS